MNEIFELLTIVSKFSSSNWTYIAIQVSMWIAVASQIFLLVPDMAFVVRSKDTRQNKWFKWIVWFVCSAGWISYAIFLIWDEIPIEETVGLIVSEGFNLICLMIIYGVKLRNIIIARRIGLSEERWCYLQNSFYFIKKAMPKPIRQNLKKACKNLTPTKRLELYVKVIRSRGMAERLKQTFTNEAGKVAKQMIKKTKKRK